MSGVRGDGLNNPCETCGGSGVQPVVPDTLADLLVPRGSRPVPEDRPSVSHGMVPGSHERAGGPWCHCGQPWDRWNDRHAARPVLPEQPVPESCDEPVWDGPYRMRCGYMIVNSRCVRHGAQAKRSPVPAVQPVLAPDPEGRDRAVKAVLALDTAWPNRIPVGVAVDAVLSAYFSAGEEQQ